MSECPLTDSADDCACHPTPARPAAEGADPLPTEEQLRDAITMFGRLAAIEKDQVHPAHEYRTAVRALRFTLDVGALAAVPSSGVSAGGATGEREAIVEPVAVTPRPPMEHELKVWPEPFAALQDGRKTFEWRKDDRDFRVGDTLVLNEFLPREGMCTVQCEVREITYILRGRFGVPDGYAVLGLRDPAHPGAAVRAVPPSPVAHAGTQVTDEQFHDFVAGALHGLEQDGSPFKGCEESDEKRFRDALACAGLKVVSTDVDLFAPAHAGTGTITDEMAIAAYWQHAEENGDRPHPGDAIAPPPTASDIAEWKSILTAALSRQEGAG